MLCRCCGVDVMYSVYFVKASVPSSLEESKKGLYPPLGIMYLSSIARLEGFKPVIYDLDIDSTSTFLNKVSSERPDAIGFSVVTQNYYSTVDLIKMVREYSPDTIVFVGGPHATLVPEDFTGLADIVVTGEGEEALSRVLKMIEKGVVRDCLSTRKTMVIHGSPITDLDRIPFPDRESIDIKRYGENSGTMFTSRGCPYNCLFCTTRYIMGRLFRSRSPWNVLSEWRILVNKYRVPKVRILDDVFTFKRDRVIEILRGVIEEGLGPWSLPNGVHVNNVDEELLKYMGESGCTTVWYGVESGDQRVLNVLRKAVRLDRVEEVVKWTRDYGIAVGLFFMVGAPGETLESVYKTIEFINRVEPDYIHISIATPYPNTEFWEWVERNGRFITRDYRLFEKTFIFETPNYPLRDRLKALELYEKELGWRYSIDFE